MSRAQSDIGNFVTKSRVATFCTRKTTHSHTNEHFKPAVVVCNFAIISLHFSTSFYIRALKRHPAKEWRVNISQGFS